jgi:hypothetical protein
MGAGSEDVKNFHLPLPEQTYNHLREQAERARAPATTLARQAIEWWLRQQVRKARHDAIAAYAAEAAGTDFDLDPELESAGIGRLVKGESGQADSREAGKRPAA